MMMPMMIVIMAVVVTTAAFFSIMMVIVMMIMTAGALFPVMIVMVLMIVMMVLMVVIVAVLMIMLLFPVGQHFLHQLLLQIGAVLDGLQDFLSVQLDDGRSDQRGPAVVLPDQIHSLLHLFRTGDVRSAQDNRSGVLNLVNEKFSEILNVHFALGSVHHRNGAV